MFYLCYLSFLFVVDVRWRNYGARAPNLQRFAIWILSQTCTSLRCEHNWIVFEKIHSKKRTRLELAITFIVICNLWAYDRLIYYDPQNLKLIKFFMTLLHVGFLVSQWLGVCPLQSPTMVEEYGQNTECGCHFC